MASSTSSSSSYTRIITSLLIALLIFLAADFKNNIIAEANSYRGVENLKRSSRIDSKKLLSDLGYDLEKMAKNYRRFMADTDRLVPEGPDPHHH
ncbi:hypothetical protein M9H77_26074 [Catharanthus roseus]|uniref:Uncharacterized protein n=1 Tax=Catharanthus roseus TaxID=4058 RepID=A0ACC0A935_CATRO|nr:hypothetical protein M9H77_26074 [Catharanthus roseus]